MAAYPRSPTARAAGSLLLLAVAAPPALCAPEAPVQPLPQAHAHNDYYHRRPLLDALGHGFCSVEADVFLVEGELLVGHSRLELRPDRTLEMLYLKPLQARVESNGGRVFAGGPGFTLLVDIKADGERAYAALHSALAPYRGILTTVENGRVTPGAVTVVVSGDRAFAAIAASNPRFAGIDGRLGDLESDRPAHLMPLISDRWGSHFRWRGTGPLPEAERERLKAIVARAHAAGRRVRFWATPENPATWEVLRGAGVDHINTDDLAGLQRFLRGKGEPAGRGDRGSD